MATAGLMVTTYACVLVAPTASVALTVKLKEPVAVGVPLSAPRVLFSVRPVGKVPVLLRLIGVVPPETSMNWVYAAPTSPLGKLVVAMNGSGLIVTAYVKVELLPVPSVA